MLLTKEMTDLFSTKEMTDLLYIEDKYRYLTYEQSINKINYLAKVNKMSAQQMQENIMGEWKWVDDNEKVVKLVKSLLVYHKFEIKDISKCTTVKEIFDTCCGIFTSPYIPYKPPFVDMYASNVFFSYRWFKFLNIKLN